MMAAAVSEFDNWLNGKLKSLNTDEGVFGSYISGILDGDDTVDEKREALEGILSEIIQNDISFHVNEIIDKWTSCQPVLNVSTSINPTNVDEQLAKLLESQSLTTTAPRQYTDEEKKIREAILSQYSQMSDNEDTENISGDEGTSSELVKNTNASTVAAAAKERREQAKLDSQKKKDKDKEDREKQKQLREDKKEKRKTQKGERRR